MNELLCSWLCAFDDGPLWSYCAPYHVETPEWHRRGGASMRYWKSSWAPMHISGGAFHRRYGFHWSHEFKFLIWFSFLLALLWIFMQHFQQTLSSCRLNPHLVDMRVLFEQSDHATKRVRFCWICFICDFCSHSIPMWKEHNDTGLFMYRSIQRLVLLQDPEGRRCLQ